jgi:hypothetical protein
MIEGRRFTFILFVIMIAVIWYADRYAKQGKKIKIRRLAALDGIPESIGRATEEGRPAHFSPGLGGISGDTAPQTFAAIAVLGYVAKLTAKHDIRLIVSIRQPEVLPLALDTVKQAYLEEDKYHSLSNTDVRFLSNAQFAYAAAVSGVMMREKPAANFLFGAFYAENLMMAEVGAQVNAFQISGSASIGQIPFFVTTTDYCLIGEELYAAAASLEGDETQLGAILGQDLTKGIAVVLLVLGVIVTAVGSNAFIELTGW